MVCNGYVWYEYHSVLVEMYGIIVSLGQRMV